MSRCLPSCLPRWRCSGRGRTRPWCGPSATAPTARARRSELAQAITDDDPDRLIYLGDVYPSGTAADFDRNYDPVYGALAARTAPTPGNHEWGNRATGYFPYWKREARPHAGSVVLVRPRGLAVPVAQLRGAPRARIAAAALARPAAWAPATAGSRSGTGLASARARHGDAPDIAPLWDAVEGRAALVLNGHDHGSQRLKRRGGTVELIAGAGGPNLYGIDKSDRRLVWADDDHVAALRIELRPGRATYEFRTADGRVLRRGAASCSTS